MGYVWFTQGSLKWRCFCRSQLYGGQNPSPQCSGDHRANISAVTTGTACAFEFFRILNSHWRNGCLSSCDVLFNYLPLFHCTGISGYSPGNYLCLIAKHDSLKCVKAPAGI